MSTKIDKGNSIPPGFHFVPSDEEIVVHYLLNKNMGLPLLWDGIREIDIYGRTPEEILGQDSKRQVFGFAKLKTLGKGRVCRSTPTGEWHGNSCIKIFDSETNEVIGFKKQLTFREKNWKKANGNKNYVMYEYSLPERLGNKTAYVLCQLMKSSKSRKRSREETGEGNKEMKQRHMQPNEEHGFNSNSKFARSSGVSDGVVQQSSLFCPIQQSEGLAWSSPQGRAVHLVNDMDEPSQSSSFGSPVSDSPLRDTDIDDVWQRITDDLDHEMYCLGSRVPTDTGNYCDQLTANQESHLNCNNVSNYIPSPSIAEFGTTDNSMRIESPSYDPTSFDQRFLDSGFGATDSENMAGGIITFSGRPNDLYSTGEAECFGSLEHFNGYPTMIANAGTGLILHQPQILANIPNAVYVPCTELRQQSGGSCEVNSIMFNCSVRGITTARSPTKIVTCCDPKSQSFENLLAEDHDAILCWFLQRSYWVYPEQSTTEAPYSCSSPDSIITTM